MADTIICSPWSQRVLTVSSKRESCARCGRDIAVSKVTRKAMPDARLICGRCGKAEAPDAQGSLHESTRQEILALTGRDPAEERLPTLAEAHDVGEEGFRARRRAQRARWN